MNALKIWLGRRSTIAALIAATLLLSAGSRPALAGGQDKQDKDPKQDQPHRGRKYTPPPPTAQIKITVLRSTNGKAIPNAAVILHPINKAGKDEGALELKSNEDGIVSIDVIPIGDTVRLQVISDGWQTFGDDYPIESPTKEIVVKMKRPTAQYSIYSNNNATAPNNTTPQGSSSSAKPSEQTPVPK